jgi:hypothetical protein
MYVIYARHDSIHLWDPLNSVEIIYPIFESDAAIRRFF